MKKRIFYIVNLDKERILILFFISLSLLAISFTTGYRMGITQNQKTSISSGNIEIPVPSIDTKQENKKSIEFENKLSKKTDLKNESKTIDIETLKNAEKISLEENLPTNITKSTEPKFYTEPFKRRETETEDKVDKKEQIRKNKKKYYIQIISFKKEENAQKFLDKLLKENIDAKIKNNKNYYTLYIEVYSDQELSLYKEKFNTLNIKNIYVKRIY